MSKSFFKVELKTKPYLAKFMKYNYGEHLQFHISDDFGHFIAGLLDKSLYPNMEKKTVNNYLSDYPTRIQLMFPYNWLVNCYYGYFINDKNVIWINKQIQEKFENRLYLYIACNIIADKRYKDLNKTIESFCAKCNIIIDEDISWDAIVKLAYRARNKINNDIKKDCEARVFEVYQGILFN